MELALRWSQRSSPSSPRFLIVDLAGRTFKHCQVIDYKEGNLQWEEISRNSKVPSFRAFDWSFLHNVVAVGQWSGETTVLGLENGSRSLSLPIKSQRQCNAVTFNSESLLATGLERVRNDFCLNVYDINHWISSHTSSSQLSKQRFVDPVQRLATSEGITSIKFFTEQPSVLVAGVKGTCVRIYDLRESTGNPSLQYQTTCVHNIAIDPCDQNYFASTGPQKDPTVHVWDKRSRLRPVAGSVTPANHPLTQDGPILELRDVFNSHRDPEPASIWSLRYSIAERGSLGILGNDGNFRTFQTKQDFVGADADSSGEKPKSDFVQPIYVSRSEVLGRSRHHRRRGSRTTVMTENERVVAFDFLNLLSSNQKPCAITLRANQEVCLQQLPGPPPTLATSVRSSVAITDWTGTRKRAKGSTATDGLRIYQASQEGQIAEALAKVKENVRRGTKASTGQADEYSESDEDEIDDGWNESLPTSSQSFSRPEPRSNHREDSKPRNLGSIQDALILADATRRRCAEGYLFDSQKNYNIVKEDDELQWMWEWMTIAKDNAADEKMIADGIDFNYLGVHSIWNNDLGPNASSRLLPNSSSNPSISEAISSLTTALSLPSLPLQTKTSKPAHRLLCLLSLGFNSNPVSLTATVKSLALSGSSTRAALHALLLSVPKLASTALRSGPRATQHRALGLLLTRPTSASSSSTSISADSSLLTASSESIALLPPTNDPFAQAIIALLTPTFPFDPPPNLPPAYYVALALVILPDNSLTAFLASTLKKTTSVSYLCLTGLTYRAPSLFRKYVARTGDVQSVVLALGSVRADFYLGNDRDNSQDDGGARWAVAVEAWWAAYRTMLNKWKLWVQRARFDVLSTKIAAASRQNSLGHTGISMGSPVQRRQIGLACSSCEGALHIESLGLGVPGSASGGLLAAASPTDAISNAGGGKTARANAGAAKKRQSKQIGDGVLGAGSRDGTKCPRCGARLPRCVVCDFWVGEGEAKRAKPKNAMGNGGADNGSGGKGGNSINGQPPGTHTGTSVESGSNGSPSKNNNTDGEKSRAGESPLQGRRTGGRSAESNKPPLKERKEEVQVDLMAGFVEVCLSCRHVYHRGHAREWFARHKVCASVECVCRCDDVDPKVGKV